VPASGVPAGYWPGAPDLAVEVLSPGDRVSEVDTKVAAWLGAGATAVWVVNPRWRTVTVYRSATDIMVLTENETLDGLDVVDGFHCPVLDLFGLTRPG
jgi:Uma2 family endonuclease